MTDIDSMIAVLTAAKDGKVIQKRLIFERGGAQIWRYPEDHEGWDFTAYEFRVKPEPEVKRVYLGTSFIEWKGSNKPNLELTFEDGKLTGAKVL